MIELPRGFYHRAMSLFDRDMPNTPILFAVLEGRYPGHLFVDDEANVTRGVVTTGIGFAFGGGIFDQPALNEAVVQLRQGRNLSLVWAPPLVGRLMPPPQVTKEFDRLEFRNRRLPALAGDAAARRLPAGCALRRMDAPLFARAAWRAMHEQAAGTSDNFLAHGFGFCLMRDEEILCEAYAGFFGAGEWEIGAITHEGHRGRGYATVTCTHVIELCEAAGQPTRWSCETDNAASVATARRLGYTSERLYTLLFYAPTA